MNTQPEVLLYAEWLESHDKDFFPQQHTFAAELRRLHTLNKELMDSFDEILAVKFSNWSDGEMRDIARTAIARAEGTCKAEGEQP